ncbi:MAG TPA: response regulator transcription factor [Acidimicrobiales bacterium]
MTPEVRVVIADDHPVVRQGLRTFLATQEGIAVVGEAADGAEALVAAGSLSPDVVLLDLVMPGIDGVAVIARLTAENLDTKVLVLTSFPDDDKLLAAVQAGAAGYLLKDVAPAELANAVRAVARGEAALSSRPAARLLREYAQGGSQTSPAPLTRREQEVLALVGRGLANKQIARELSIAEKTVKTHVSHVLSKLGLADRTQAALYAVRVGLVDPGAGSTT